MDEISILKDILLRFGTGTLPLLIVVLYLFKHPEKFEHWMRLFYAALYYITSKAPRIRRNIDQRLVAVDIQDTINRVGDEINYESPDALPHAVKIEWVRIDTPESFIAKGKVVVRLSHYRNRDRNIVESTLLYLKKGLLPRARNYLDNTLRRSCQYKIATNIFVTRRDTGAYDYFLENELNPAIATDSSIESDLQMLENLDSVGFFTRVFLTEVTTTGQKLIGMVPTSAVRKELRDFASFLEIIATKGKDEDVPLQFKGTKVRASVILVGGAEIYRLYGIDPYVNRVQRSVREDYDSIYLAAWGEEFVKASVRIKKQIEEQIVIVVRRYDYPVGGETKGILFLCQPRSSYLAQQEQLREEVRNALADAIPEIKEGDIRVISVVRIRNVGFKVAVKSEKDELPDPKACCLGAGGQWLNQLKRRFPDEFIGILSWSDDLKELIVNSLTPLNPKYVDYIEIDDENLVANVFVLTQEAMSKAIGKSGYNVRLASELTGYLIRIAVSSSQKDVSSPENELKEILERKIPEILNKEIEIVKISRIRGVGSKVIVRWKTEDIPRTLRASQVCLGENHENLRRIRQQTHGEWVHFHDWSKYPEDQIAVCLYPLRRYLIDSIEIDTTSDLAIVTLAKGANKLETEEDQTNLALCEEVTGYKIEILSF